MDKNSMIIVCIKKIKTKAVHMRINTADKFKHLIFKTENNKNPILFLYIICIHESKNTNHEKYTGS